MSKKRKSDFTRKEIYDFATAYASSFFGDLDQCAAAYGISIYMAKQLIYESISRCIVEDATVQELYKKAYNSALNHCYNEGILKAPVSVCNKYRQLLKLRKTFCLSNEHAVQLTYIYLTSPLNKVHFCQKYYITTSLLNRTLQKVIVENLVPDSTVSALQQKALFLYHDSSVVNTFFMRLWKARNYYIQNHI